MSKITGVDILILVEVDAEWKAVGGQRGATLSESRDTISVSSKLSPGLYNENEYGFGEWTISCDGVYVESEEAFVYLVDAMRDREKVMVKWQEAGVGVVTGMAIVTSRDLEGPYDGEATYSMELVGDGQPTPVDNYSNNLSALTGIEQEAAAALDFIPDFSGGVYQYVTTVNSASGWITLTPTAAQGVITVNGNVVPSGSASSQITLGAAGSLTDVIVKVQEEGKIARSYKITVARSDSA